MSTAFTIVIPVYNDVELCRRALDSVLRQDFDSFDIVVSDDSTTDDIEEAIGLMGVQRVPVNYLHNRPSLGAVANWNRGMKEATGRYVIVMHHDEAMADTNYLKTIYAHLEKGADVAVSAITVMENGTERKRRFTPTLVRFFLRHPSLLFLANAIGPCACVAFRREQMQDFDTHLHWLVDVEWYYRLSRRRRVVYDPQLHILSLHGHQGQITGETDIPAMFRQDRTILRKKYQRPAVRLFLLLQQVLKYSSSHHRRHE